MTSHKKLFTNFKKLQNINNVTASVSATKNWWNRCHFSYFRNIFLLVLSCHTKLFGYLEKKTEFPTWLRVDHHWQKQKQYQSKVRGGSGSGTSSSSFGTLIMAELGYESLKVPTLDAFSDWLLGDSRGESAKELLIMRWMASAWAREPVIRKQTGKSRLRVVIKDSHSLSSIIFWP